LDLSPGFDQILKRWKRKGPLWGVRRAIKEGVLVTAAKTENNWQQYFSAYQDSLDRWGDSATSNYSWLLFKELYERRSANIKLWIAIHEDKIIAGALCFYSKRHVAYWRRLPSADFFRFRP
jgi:predicted N-acyltransferase